MKRIAAIVLAALMLMGVLAACGESSGNSGSTPSVDLNTVMTGVNTAFGIGDGMKVLSTTDELKRYYQIEAEDVKSFAAEYSTDAAVYTEVVIVEANDSAAADRVKAKLDERRTKQLSDAKSYHPEQVAIIEACSTQQAGNIVYLVISDKYSDIVNNIKGALG